MVDQVYKQAVKHFLAAGIVCGFILLLINLLINNPYSQKFIRAAVMDAIRQHTHLDVSFEAFSLSVVPLKAELYALRVEAQSSYKVPPLLAASRVIVRGSWWSVLLGNKRLHEVEIHDVDLIWPPPWDFKGFLREPASKPLASAPKPVKRKNQSWLPDDFPVDHIEVHHARLYAEVPVTAEIPQPLSYFALKVGEGDVDLYYKGWRRSYLDIDFKGVQLQSDEDIMLSEANLKARFAIEGEKVAEKIAARGVELKSSESDLRFDIELRPDHYAASGELAGLQLSALGEGFADLKILGAFLGIKDTHGPLDGRFHMQAHIGVAEDRHSSFLIGGQAQARDGYIDGFRLHNTLTDFSIDEDQINFANTALIIGDREVARGQGHIGLNEQVPFHFSIAPQGLSLSELMGSLHADFDVFDAKMASSNLIIEGQGEPFSLRATADAVFTDIEVPRLKIEKKRFHDSPHCNLGLELAVNSERLRFSKADASCLPTGDSAKEKAVASRVNLSGDIHFDDGAPVNLVIESQQLQLPLLNYFLQFPWQGTARLRSTVTGTTGAEVTVTNQFQGQAVTLAGVPFESMQGSFVVRGDVIEWPRIDGRVKEGATLAFAKGRYHLLNDHWQSEWQLAGLAREWVALFFAAIPEPLALSFGVETWTGRAEGYFFLPASFRGKSEFKLSELNYAGELLADRAEGVFDGERDKMQLQPLNLWLGRLRHSWQLNIEHSRHGYGPEPAVSDGASWWARLGFHRDDKVSMLVRTFHDQSREDASPAGGYFHRLPVLAPYFSKVKLDGEIKLEAKLNGSFRGLQGSLSGSLDRLSLWDAGLPPLQFKGFVEDGRLDLTLQHAGGALAGRMSSDFGKPGVPFDWYLSFSQLDLRAVGSRYFSQDARNYAYLSGSWNLKGHYNDWWRAVGSLQLSSVRAKYHLDVNGRTQSIDVRNKEPVTIAFKRDGWSLQDGKPLRLEGEHLGVQLALLPSKPPQRLQVKAEGHLKLAVLAKMSQEIESATGQLGFSADLVGPVSDLELRARLFDVKKTEPEDPTWEEVSLGFTELRPELKQASLDVSYHDGIVHLHHFSAKKGTGSVRAQGRFHAIEGEGEEGQNNINVVFDQIKMIYPIPYLKSFDTTLSGELQITGQRRPYLLSGDVKVVKARSTRKFDVRNEVVKAMRQESIDLSTRRATKAPLMRFNVNINADQSITINNESMQLWISAFLQLQGTNQNPILLGNVDLDKGTFFYKREFEVQRGEIIFDNPLKINPRLDILAIAPVDTYQVTVAVQGEAAKPTVEFLVDPATRDDGSVVTNLDAIVLLSTGSLPPSGKESLELRGTALSEVLNYAGQVPFDKLTETLGQKYIHVYPEFITDDTGAPTIQINVPVRITNNVEMVLKRTPNKSKAAVEVPLHDSITVSGSVEQGAAEDTSTTKENTGQGSVDLRFRFSFK